MSFDLQPRGSALINSANRGDYRKWFVSKGVAATVANDMPNHALATAYNDLTDATLNVLRSGVRFWKDAEPAQTVAPVAPVAANGDLAKTVQDLIGILTATAGKASIDADQVRAIMRDELPGLIPVTRIEIKTPEGTKVTEGLHHKQFAQVLRWAALRENICLVGAAGGGKTTIGEQVANALGLKFHLTGQLDSSFILSGHTDGAGTYHSTAFRHAFEHGGVFIGDELDGWDANALLWVNGATANGHATFPDSPHPVKRHADFIFIACCNTWGNGASREYVGRNQLDAATLDRFAFLHLEYDEKLERAIAGNDTWVDRVQSIRRAVTAEKVRMIVSPRASIKGAKALAAGIPQHEVEDALIWKGVDTETRRRIDTRARA